MHQHLRSLPARARRGLLALAALAALALLVAAVAAGAARLPTLHRGDRGPAVTRLQRALHVHADGVFGRGTVRAVKRFQRRHRLRADGVVGPSTWRMIRRSQRARAGSRGDRRHEVQLLQRRLHVPADGVFGPGTARAVKRFQRRHGLTADGVVGPATWAALGLGGARPVLKRARVRRDAGTIVRRAVRAGDRIARLPYRYGGGHGSFRDSGYDCSGSVSYLLHGAGLLPRPLDSGQFMTWGAPGPGRRITVYANPGHAFVVVDGRRFDTTGRAQTGSRWQPSMRSTAGYVARHPAGL